MRFYLKPPHWRDSKKPENCTWKDASLCGFFHWGFVAKRRKQVDKYPGDVPWHIQGWYWPLGVAMRIWNLSFTWYSKRYWDLKCRGHEDTEWCRSPKVRWWGVFLP